MNEVVFDASAMLALIQHERGEEKLTDEILDRAVASTVNLAEVQSKLVKMSNDPDKAWEAALLFYCFRSNPSPRASQDCRRSDSRRRKSTACRWATAPAWRWRLRSRLRSIPPNSFGET
jgi:PIN domain nuclease of toxin-antitoxin system